MFVELLIIFLIFPIKLGNCVHSQVFAFIINGQTFLESPIETEQHHWSYETNNPLLQVCFINLKINHHTNLSFDTILWEVFFKLFYQWEDTIQINYHGNKDEPVKLIEEYQVWISIYYQATVSISH